MQAAEGGGDRPLTEEDPVELAVPSQLTETLCVFTKWLHLPDAMPVLAVLGTVAANQLPGDAVWLGIVAPPSSAKTEILNALRPLPDVYEAATLTPASLLSGTPKKEKAKTAKCGLLRQIGATLFEGSHVSYSEGSHESPPTSNRGADAPHQ